MADDRYISKGLNQKDMAKFAAVYRVYFGIPRDAQVDIVDIVEFKLAEADADYRFIVIADDKLKELAFADPSSKSITVRQSVYESACEGDFDSRFVLAHELGHYIMHHKFVGGMSKLSRNQEYEKPISNMNLLESAEDQADIFARHFLIDIRLAYQHKADPHSLSKATGVGVGHARAMITVSKRIEMYELR